MEINNNLFNNENKQINKEINTCDICKNNEGEYECQECSTFKILCSNCDNYIHSMESKSSHNRKKIMQGNNININIQSKFNDNNDINTNNNIQKKTSPITNNYLEQIKSIYEQDKKLITTENDNLQRKINTNESLYKYKINNLQNKLDELKFKNESNLRLMKDNHNMDIKQLITEKDFEINYLMNNNKELEKINSELKAQLTEKMSGYASEQSKYKDILTNLEFTYNNLKKEKMDIKEFYESKINFLIENFNAEKNKLINSYELNINQLNNDYNESKDKYINYFNKIDVDIEHNISENKIEIDKLKEKIKNLSTQVDELRDRRDNLIKINNELKFNNNNLNENFERVRKELIHEIKKKKLEEEKVQSTQREFNKAQKENKRISKRAQTKRSKSVKY